MLLLFLFFFFLLVFLVLIPKIELLGKKYFFPPILFFLIFLAAFKPIDFDRDYNSYNNLFNGDGAFLFTEPTFQLITYFIHEYLNSQLVFLFLIYSIFGVYFKLLCIDKLSHYFLLSVLLYFVNFYFYHEMTQIRVGLGCGLLYFSLISLQKKQYYKSLFFVLIATLFHYSLIIWIVVFFLNFNELKKKNYLFVLFAVYFLHYFNFHFSYLFSFLDLPFLNYKIGSNSVVKDITLEEPVKVFNWLQVTRIVILFFLFQFIERLQALNKYSIILVKLYFLSIIVFVLFADNGVYSFRLNQIFGFSEVLILPHLVHIFNRKFLFKFVFILFSAIFLVYNLFIFPLFSF